MLRGFLLVCLVGGCLYTNNRKCEQVGYPPDDELYLLDPESLFCETFLIPGCDEDCGVCEPPPEDLPSWAVCESRCFGYNEEMCLGASGCRVARYRAGYYSQLEQDPLPSFQGCYPLDTNPGAATDCHDLSAQDCSRYDYCTYLVEFESMGECIRENQIAGRCSDQVTCTTPPPSCPPDTTPGIADGCYTGSCIPTSYCGV